MNYKATIPIHTLVKQAMSTTPAHYKWLNVLAMRACKQSLPFIANKIKQCTFKKGILYIRLGSALLCHELRLNKPQVIKRIQASLKQLGGEGSVLKDIVFS